MTWPPKPSPQQLLYRQLLDRVLQVRTRNQAAGLAADIIDQTEGGDRAGLLATLARVRADRGLLPLER